MTGTGPLLRGLVCEDDPVITRALLVVMGSCGFKSVTVVATGQEAVARAARTAPQLAVIDLALTGVRGVSLIRELVQVAPRCKVVAVSPFRSLERDALAAKALAAGAAALCELSELRDFRSCLEHALEHPAMEPDVCDCHRVTSSRSPASFRSSSAPPTTTSGSWVARYQPGSAGS